MLPCNNFHLSMENIANHKTFGLTFQVDIKEYISIQSILIKFSPNICSRIVCIVLDIIFNCVCCHLNDYIMVGFLIHDISKKITLKIFYIVQYFISYRERSDNLYHLNEICFWKNLHSEFYFFQKLTIKWRYIFICFNIV